MESDLEEEDIDYSQFLRDVEMPKTLDEKRQILNEMIKLRQTQDKIRGYYTVVLGFTGSIASMGWKQLVLEFLDKKCNVICVMT